MRIGSVSETAVNVRDGYSSFVITLYKRSLTAIETTGIGKLFFTFKNNSLSSGVDGKTLEECLNGWSRTVPNGKNPLYCTSATAFGNKDIDDIQPNEWTTPTVMSENGTKGENGLTTSTILLYKRSDEIPETPQSEITYDFYSGEVTGSLSGWSTTLPDFNGKALWGTNATVSATLGENVQTGSITKEKWSIPKKIVTDGKDGKSPVESYIDSYTFLLVADQYGVISSKEYTTINAKVVLMQKGEKLTSVAYGSSLENGNFYITRAENGITNTKIELDTIKGTTDSVMLKDSASVILTITYKDLDGELGSLIKTVYIKKVYTPKEAEPMLFAWSSSEDVFTPKDTNRVWMYSDKYVLFDNKLIGDFALYNFVEWDEVVKAKSDEYPYLWCKYTPKGTPILFSGRDGKNGLNGQYTAFQYYASTSDTTQQGGVWSDTVPSIAGGKYLWMRTQVVPAGGSISASAWGTPVLAGTDISYLMASIDDTNERVTSNTSAISANAEAIDLRVTQTVYDKKITSIESAIEQTANKIALTVETVNGENVVKNNGIVISSEKDGEGNILIGADKILLNGSVTADKIDTDSLMSKELVLKNQGSFHSEGYEKGDADKSSNNSGFYLDTDGSLEATNARFKDIVVTKGTIKDATFNNVQIVGGTFSSDSLDTRNENITGDSYSLVDPIYNYRKYDDIKNYIDSSLQTSETLSFNKAFEVSLDSTFFYAQTISGIAEYQTGDALNVFEANHSTEDSEPNLSGGGSWIDVTYHSITIPLMTDDFLNAKNLWKITAKEIIPIAYYSMGSIVSRPDTIKVTNETTGEELKYNLNGQEISITAQVSLPCTIKFLYSMQSYNALEQGYKSMLTTRSYYTSVNGYNDTNYSVSVQYAYQGSYFFRKTDGEPISWTDFFNKLPSFISTSRINFSGIDTLDKYSAYMGLKKSDGTKVLETKSLSATDITRNGINMGTGVISFSENYLNISIDASNGVVYIYDSNHFYKQGSYPSISFIALTAQKGVYASDILPKGTTARLGVAGQEFASADIKSIKSDTVDTTSINATNLNSKPINRYAYIKDDGVMEVGKYIDFHTDGNPNSGTDYHVRLQARSDGIHVYVNGKDDDIGIWGAVAN